MRMDATRSHLVGDVFGVLPEAPLKLQLLRHLSELLCDELGNYRHTHARPSFTRHFMAFIVFAVLYKFYLTHLV